MRRFIRHTFLSFLLITLSSLHISAQKTWYVSAQGSDAKGRGTQAEPWQTLKLAHDHFWVKSGDTISIAPGNYVEHIDVTKSLAFVGPNSKLSPKSPRNEEAIIKGLPDFKSVFEVSKSGVKLLITGLQFIGSSPLHDGNHHREKDADIFIQFEKNIVKNANTVFAGTLTPWKQVNIIDNAFIDINATTSANAIQFYDASNQAASLEVIISDNIINGSTYGAIYIDNVKSAIIDGNKISNIPHTAIQVSGAAGSIMIRNNELKMVNTSKAKNEAGFVLYDGAFLGPVSFHNNQVGESTYNGVIIKAPLKKEQQLSIQQNSFINLTAGSLALIYNINDGKKHVNTGTVSGVKKVIANCNWFGNMNPAIVSKKIAGAIEIKPWLLSGNEDLKIPGFQPLTKCANSITKPAAKSVAAQ